jgi:hypothetical protein
MCYIGKTYKRDCRKTHRGRMGSVGSWSKTSKSWQERPIDCPFIAIFSFLPILCSWRSDGQIEA